MAEFTGSGNAVGLILATAAQGFSGAATPRAVATRASDDGFAGGTATIIGITQVQTGPTTYVRLPNCPVWLYDQTTGAGPIRKTVSDAQGNYTFTGLSADRTYFDVAFDPAGTYDVAATRNLEITP